MVALRLFDKTNVGTQFPRGSEPLSLEDLILGYTAVTAALWDVMTRSPEVAKLLPDSTMSHEVNHSHCIENMKTHVSTPIIYGSLTTFLPRTRKQYLPPKRR